MQITIDQIKKLRDQTGVGVMDAKRALEESDGNFKQAEKILKKQGKTLAEKKAGREALRGKVCSYIHSGERIGVLLEVGCETDFAAETSEFGTLCSELAMQIAAMEPKTVKGLLKQEYIRDAQKTVEDLIKETIAKVGENVVIRRFVRYELGKNKNSKS